MRGVLFIALVGCSSEVEGTAGVPPASRPTERPAPDGMGSLRVLLHDAPGPAVDEVWVAWDEVKVHEVDGAWHVVSTNPAQVDLLSLVDGVVTDLGLAQVPVGSYDEVRFVLTDAWVVDGGVTAPLDVPSGDTSGLKVKVDFTIEDCGDTTVTLDWDVGAHLIENPHGYKLSPVLKAESSYDDGSCDACAGEVIFPDPALDAAIRARVGIPTGPLTAADLQVPAMGSLNLANLGLTDLTGLECAGGTPYYLNLTGNPGLRDLSAMASLTGVTALYVTGTGVADLSPLTGLPSLRVIGANGAPVTDLIPLGTLPALVQLELQGVPAVDFTPLRGAEALQVVNARDTHLASSDVFHPTAPLTRLYLARSRMAEIDDLAMGSLTLLELDHTLVADLSPLAAAPLLEWVLVSGTPVTDLSPLQSSSHLLGVRANGTGVSDLSPLSGKPLVLLEAENTAVTDWTPLGTLPTLQSLNVRSSTFDDLGVLHPDTELVTLLAYLSRLDDISALSGATRLSRLEVAYTQVTDVSPLWGSPTLARLKIDHLALTDIAGMDLPALTELNLDGDPITDLSPLSGAPHIGFLGLSHIPATDFSVVAGLADLYHLDVRATAFDCAGTLANDLRGAGVNVVCP
ncbi:MAG: DUF4382 domain-containing protein [Alphaproteobacteria bacterium]|nr:DUF4382 domain-containing protein [Alphaproteobacteria bacterium]